MTAAHTLQTTPPPADTPAAGEDAAGNSIPSTGGGEAWMFGLKTWGQTRRGWQPETARYYIARCHQAARWLEQHRGLELEQATTDDVQAWLDSCPPDPKTRNTYRAALVAFYDWHVSLGLRNSNPARNIERIRERPSAPKAPHADDVAAILTEAQREPGLWRVGIMLMAYCGLRIGEACAVQHADLDHGWLNVTGKGARRRSVPVPETLMDELRAWQVQSGSASWVLPSPRRAGRHVHPTTLRRHVERIAGSAGVDRFTPHMLRHGYASRLLELGVDVRTIQALLGHSQLATTSVYLRVRPPRLQDAADRLDYRVAS